MFFADDSLFFSKADSANALCLMEIINSYCLASGQSLNLDKSSIFFSKSTDDTTTTTVAALFNIPVSECPGTYLGIPSTGGKPEHKLLPMFVTESKTKLMVGRGIFCHRLVERF